eukprot:186397_1
MTTVLKRLSVIDDRTKYGVYGWIRKAEQELQLPHIPLMISNICILYYNYDIWNQTITNSKIKIDDKSISTSNNIGYKYRVAFGTKEISAPMINKWHLSIGNGYKSRYIVIGIIDSYTAHWSDWSMNGNFYNELNNGYGLKGIDGALFHGGNKPTEDYSITMGSTKGYFDCGDKIEMILNLQDGILKYVINDKDKGVRIRVTKGSKYKLCVALCESCSLVLHE